MEIHASQAEERLDQSCLSIACSALSLARSAQVERDNESCSFGPTDKSPPNDTCNLKGATDALPAFWKEITHRNSHSHSLDDTQPEKLLLSVCVL
ncbi:hypothetical protein EVAR_57306_1 [Eumeta japonica]|uniref:Uncharacterized protein n=1 Tax=Eumeta variegata TaxID=151549 RepID=A0A4C1YQ85_EUMVA|nr:hypothetical protein EVAR_57306_1 [Eumeta japonica]